jgi:hypothetical protein
MFRLDERPAFRDKSYERLHKEDHHMKLQRIFSAMTLALAVSLPIAAQATSLSASDLLAEETSGVLHTKPKWNKDLEAGDYAFAATHDKHPSSYFDIWKFTLAEDSNVSISLTDIEVPLNGALPAAFSGDKHSNPEQYCSEYGMLLDSKYLTFSLFDKGGNLLGAAGEDGTLTALNLLAGEWYTLTVSAKVGGIFGSAYHGSMEVQPVPLGDTLPLFGSALLVLAIRACRKVVAV